MTLEAEFPEGFRESGISITCPDSPMEILKGYAVCSNESNEVPESERKNDPAEAYYHMEDKIYTDEDLEKC